MFHKIWRSVGLRGTRGTYVAGGEFDSAQGLMRHAEIVSLWDIMDHHFKPYVGMIGQEFILLSAAIMALRKATESDTLDKQGIDSMKQHGEFLLNRATELDLAMSKNKAATLLHYVMNNANALEIRVRARDLMETMRHEVFLIQFLPVPASRLKYTEADPFGPDVAA